MRYFFLVVSVFIIISECYSQCSTIHGTLNEPSGEPLIFATVAVYRNGLLLTGTDSDIDGKYSIYCCVGDLLEISYIGYGKKRINVTYQMINGAKDSEDLIFLVRSDSLKASRDLRSKQILKKYNIKLPETSQMKTNLSEISYHPDKYQIRRGAVKFKKDTPWYTHSEFCSSLALGWLQDSNIPSLQTTLTRGHLIAKEGLQYDASQLGSWGPSISNLKRVDEGELTYLPSDKGSTPFDNVLLGPVLSYDLHVATSLSNNIHQKQWDLAFDLSQSKDILQINRLSKLEFSIHRHFKDKVFRSAKASFSRTASPQFIGSTINSLLLRSNWLAPVDLDLSQKVDDSFYKAIPRPQDFGKQYQGVTNSNINLDLHFNIDNDDLNIESGYNSSTLSDPLISKDDPILIQNTFLNAVHQGSYPVLNRTFELTSTSTMMLNHTYLDLGSREEIYQPMAYITNDAKLRTRGSSRLVYEIGLYSLLSANQPSSVLQPNIYLNYRNLSLGGSHLSFAYDYKRSPKTIEAVFQNFNFRSQHLNSGMTTADMAIRQNPADAFLLFDQIDRNEIMDKQTLVLEWRRYYHRQNSYVIKLLLENQYHQNVILPIASENSIALANVGNYHLNQIQLSFNTNHHYRFRKWKDFNWITDTKLVKYDTRVSRANYDNIIISGFANASRQFVKGHPVGVIVGHDYLRNEAGQSLIGNDGFPIVNEESNIIGDPTPDLIVSTNWKFMLGNWSLNFELGGQIGGQVWNGTQQDLDYYGRSAFTAVARDRTNYIFEGVTLLGEFNSKPIGFYDKSLEENRWVRYGARGVAADYIRDASHLMLKYLALAYRQIYYHRCNCHIEASVQANNLVTVAGFRGFTTNGLWNDAAGQGLLYYNQPILSSVGIGLAITY